ncbi:MAG: hypothetical protein M3P30_05120 [Chloroflexota bacterium]|nr:hypothetical protein [Chloroflexota bacterium]
MGVDELRAVVEAQAAARLRGDTATFASYMTHQAVLQLGAVRLPVQRPRGSRIVGISLIDETSATGDVQYSGAWSYVLRTRWRLVDGLWCGTAAELVAGTLRPSWWQRLIHRASRAAEPVPPRRDLS